MAAPPGRPERLARAEAAGLTAREVEVLEGMARGQTKAQIAQGLFLAEHTVKTHARRLFAKIHAADRAHAVAIGFRNGWLA